MYFKVWDNDNQSEIFSFERKIKDVGVCVAYTDLWNSLFKDRYLKKNRGNQIFK